MLKNNSISKLGYSKNSPYRNMPFIDIHTKNGVISMNNTDIPLYAQDETGMTKILPPFSGQHQFRGNTVREIPMQQGGNFNPYEFFFEDEEEEILEEAPKIVPEQKEEQEKYYELLAQEKKRFEREQEDNFAMEIAMREFPEIREKYTPSLSNPYASPDYSNISAKSSGGNAKYAYSYLQQKGLPAHVAAGIVGNLMQESGLNPNAQGDYNPKTKKKEAIGIAQWHPDRQKGLHQFAKDKNPFDLNTQLDYLLHEAGQRGDLQRVSMAKTPEEAAYIFAKYYERPKVIEKSRMEYAKGLYNK